MSGSFIRGRTLHKEDIDPRGKGLVWSGNQPSLAFSVEKNSRPALLNSKPAIILKSLTLVCFVVFCLFFLWGGGGGVEILQKCATWEKVICKDTKMKVQVTCAMYCSAPINLITVNTF